MRYRWLSLVAAIIISLLTASGVVSAAQQTPKRGGTVVIAEAAHLEPACLNPLLESCSTPEKVLAAAYEVTPHATYRPELASAEIGSKEPFTLVYHIRPEARWSDGVPVTSRDFVFTDEAIRAQHWDLGDSWRAVVRSVRSLNAKTVRVVLRARYADWRELFGWVLPQHALAGEDLATVWSDRIDNPKTGEPIGSGPFLVERFERGNQLVLRRNPRYWGPHPAYLNRIVVRYLPPETAAEALREGKVDMIDPGPLALQAEALDLRRRPVPGIRVLSGLGNSWEHFDIHIGAGGNPALGNRLVRQALAYGIDRVEIAKAVGELTGDRNLRLEPLDSVVFLPTSRYYERNWEGYRYRPALAQRLLERAGCRRGTDGVYVCKGKKLSLRFVTASGVARRERTIELARAQLRRVGVEVNPVYVPPQSIDAALASGDFDLIQFGWINGALTGGPLDIFGCQQMQNYTGYCDRLVTRDLDQATRILDDRRRVALLNRIDARLARAVPVIPLFQNVSLFAFDADIRGVVLNDAGSFAWNAEDWWVDR